MMDFAPDTTIVAVFALGIAAMAVIGGIIALVKQRIIVDKDTGQVIDIEIPGLKAKVKTNYPSVMAILLGCGLAGGVLYWFQVKIEKMRLMATVTVSDTHSSADRRADIFLNVVPQRYKLSQSGVSTNKPVKLELEVDKGEAYDVLVHTPISTSSDGTVQRAVQFGPMKKEKVDGVEVGVYEADLVVK